MFYKTNVSITNFNLKGSGGSYLKNLEYFLPECSQN